MLVEMPDRVYSLSDYEKIDNISLENEVLSKINLLKELFSKVQVNDNYKKKRHYSQKKYEIDPNFKATVLKKREGHEKLWSGIKCLLNKLTDTNINSLELEVYSILDEIMNDYDKDIIEKTKKMLLNDMVWNKGQSKCLSRLLTSIVKTENYKNVYDDILGSLIKDYDDIITNISYKEISSEDYDEFCEVNRINNLRRSMGMFIINMMKNKLIEIDYVLNIINYFQDMLFKSMLEEGKKVLIDEITENLYILLVNGKEELSAHKDWSNIINKVTMITKKIVKENPSFTSRSKFKHMDILDSLK